MAAMKDQEYYKEVKAMVVAGREYIEMELEAMGCNVYHSQTNFIYFDAHVSPEWLRDVLAEQGIMISSNQISRVSVGTVKENKMFIGVMEELLEKAEA